MCILRMPIWLEIILILAGVALGFGGGMVYRKRVGEREIGSAEEEAKRILNEAIKSAESKKREALVEAREEIHKNRSEYEREVKERRAELSKQEHRLQQTWTRRRTPSTGKTSFSPRRSAMWRRSRRKSKN